MFYLNKFALLTTVSLLLGSQVIAAAPQKTNEDKNLVAPKQNNCGYSLTAGFILEQVRVTGAQYGYTKNGNAIGAAALPATGKVLVPSFDLTWGVTASLACYFDNKDWTLKSKFDYLSSTGDGKESQDSDSNVIPINIWRDQFIANLNADLGVAGYGKSHFDTDYYNLNIDFNRELYIDNHFTLEPKMGLKLSFIYDKVTSTFTNNGSGSGFSTSSNLGTNELKRIQDTNFWGIGPSMGLNSAWNIGKGFSMIFEGTTAILLGYSKASDKVSYSGNIASSTSSSTPHLAVLSPTIQTLLGLKYETALSDNTQKIMLKLGWDTAFYWNQRNHINVVSETTFNSSLDTFQLAEGDTFGLTGLLLNLTWSF